ncbi:lysosome-associated membrane glycoprotein 1-like [Siphateles boraxobius]|uniref:lysosome-associated membrane glycoprotein 1-like n=1 Tax=Siphateles boraxobius TaxID=180520 RepID=UPI00406450E4
MKHGLILIAIFIAATALTSGEYSSAFMGKPTTTTHNPPTTTHNPNTTTHNPNTTTHQPPTTTHNPNTTTHNPNTTTHNPNTTTHNPNTTTQHPPITTHNPNTTTHNPNTTTHSPNATTHNPNSTTHQPPTTTALPAPTPPTNMTKGSYNVTDAKGNICILANLEIGIRVNNSEVNGTFIVQPSKTNPSGDCSDKTANITLRFDEGHFILKFKNDETKKKVYVELVEYDLKYAFKRGALRNYKGKNESLELFSAAPGHSYSCKAETVYMGDGVSLDLTNYRLQAFNIKNHEFGTPDLCKADKPDYRVPIAVGIILIILIVIVVIAYLISRKRRSNGYQSL